MRIVIVFPDSLAHVYPRRPGVLWRTTTLIVPQKEVHVLRGLMVRVTDAVGATVDDVDLAVVTTDKHQKESEWPHAKLNGTVVKGIETLVASHNPMLWVFLNANVIPTQASRILIDLNHLGMHTLFLCGPAVRPNTLAELLTLPKSSLVVRVPRPNGRWMPVTGLHWQEKRWARAVRDSADNDGVLVLMDSSKQRELVPDPVGRKRLLEEIGDHEQHDAKRQRVRQYTDLYKQKRIASDPLMQRPKQLQITDLFKACRTALVRPNDERINTLPNVIYLEPPEDQEHS